MNPSARGTDRTTGPPLIVATALLTMFLVTSACQTDVHDQSAGASSIRKVDLASASCQPTDPDRIRVDTIARGLEVPWDVTFLADGRALVTERPGRIRVVRADGTLMPEPWIELNVYAENEAGLLGIDHVPTGEGRVDVYVAATVSTLGSRAATRGFRAIGRRVVRAFRPERGHAQYLRVYRIPEIDGLVGPAQVVVDGLPAASVHAGGALRVGPDGKLYLTSGDAGDPGQAQRPATTRGKILRYELDGTVPEDNPDPDSPVWARGMRNPQGLAWTTGGALLAIDHGPTGLETEAFRTDFDELNVVHPGDNLGWPMVAGASTGGGLTSPIHEWPTAIAPAGLAVLRGSGGTWAGNALVSGLRGTTLERIVLDGEGPSPVSSCREALFHTQLGRIRMVREAPDGTVWVGTSNRDHRGRPRSGSDLILGIVPPRVSR